ncbi:MAG TPA: hypothetical protein VMH20_19105 [Verrucomicrobiae bacterium]|nr:hypothetical protein [Verrucomicrobiae bacterium]
MTAKFDLFMRLPDGQPIWIKAVERLEEARKELAQMAERTPGNYFIFNASNGQLIANSGTGGNACLVHNSK